VTPLKTFTFSKVYFTACYLILFTPGKEILINMETIQGNKIMEGNPMLLNSVNIRFPTNV
jgi:hypothetical protein